MQFTSLSRLTFLLAGMLSLTACNVTPQTTESASIQSHTKDAQAMQSSQPSSNLSIQNAPKAINQLSPTIILNTQDIARLKANSAQYASIIKTCNNQLDYQPKPIAQMDVKRHYTEAGQQEADVSTVQLSKDASTAYRMGFCYLMTDDTRYATTAQRILDAWATTFNGVSTHSAQGTINFNMPYMIIAGNWVKNANNWDSQRFGNFLKNKILPLAELKNNNNHGLWAVFMTASIGAYLNDEQILDIAQARWQEILSGAVASDGTMPHELARSDTNDFVGGKTKGIKGIAYTHYALLPASMGAKVLSDMGRDVWQAQGGQLLHKAFDRAVILTLHPETSPYYASNNGNLVGVQNGSYFPLLLKYYPNKEAEQAVKLGYVGGVNFMLPMFFK